MIIRAVEQHELPELLALYRHLHPDDPVLGVEEVGPLWDCIAADENLAYFAAEADAEDAVVTFDASGSYDPDGTIISYEWDWDSDGVWDDLTTDPIITHTWMDMFEDTVRMRVTDNDNLIQSC